MRIFLISILIPLWVCNVNMWWICGEYVVNMWWTCGEYVVNMWWICDEYVVNMWWTCGEHVVNMWWTCGEYVVNMWWTCGEHVMNMWWICDEYVVNMWWTCDEYVVNMWWICDEYVMNFVLKDFVSTASFCLQLNPAHTKNGNSWRNVSSILKTTQVFYSPCNGSTTSVDRDKYILENQTRYLMTWIISVLFSTCF